MGKTDENPRGNTAATKMPYRGPGLPEAEPTMEQRNGAPENVTGSYYSHGHKPLLDKGITSGDTE